MSARMRATAVPLTVSPMSQPPGARPSARPLGLTPAQTQALQQLRTHGAAVRVSVPPGAGKTGAMLAALCEQAVRESLGALTVAQFDALLALPLAARTPPVAALSQRAGVSPRGATRADVARWLRHPDGPVRVWANTLVHRFWGPPDATGREDGPGRDDPPMVDVRLLGREGTRDLFDASW